MSKFINTLKLSLKLVHFDYRRRIAPTYFGFFWYLAPLLTVVAIAGLPGSAASRGQSAFQLFRFSLLIAGFQYGSQISIESSRLVRRNRLLLSILGVKNLVFNIAGLLSSLIQVFFKIIFLSAIFFVVGCTFEQMYRSLFLFFCAIIPITIMGLTISFLVSYLSILIHDVCLSLGYLPMVLLLLIPLSYKPNDLSKIEFISYFNPYLLLTTLNSNEFGLQGIFSLLLISSAIYLFTGTLFYFMQVRIAGLIVGRSM